MAFSAETPDLAYSPVHSEGYLSPVESDAVQTPLFDVADHAVRIGACSTVNGSDKRETGHIERIPTYDPDIKLPRIHILTAGSSPAPDDFVPSPASDASFLDYDCEIPPYALNARRYSEQFPEGHHLDLRFACTYQLEDQLGSGGYGFVMTAKHRVAGYEVAVKFIIKDKVPDYAWVDDERYGRLPTEVFLLDYMDHKNIVKGIDLFQDQLFYYLVQELHGSPWDKAARKMHSKQLLQAPSILSAPPLAPSLSLESVDSAGPATPPSPCHPLPAGNIGLMPSRPPCSRRPSYDLFECIEQSPHKRLTEDQARHVFAQVVDAVHYLDSHGISHRDIKDENIVIDSDFNVKIIDFGSAIFVDPSVPRPHYTLFYGTTAYAASEILTKKPYQAAPAEVWTLGVLLSYLLQGVSPFPTVRDAVKGRIILENRIRFSDDAMDLLQFCLHPNPAKRATIQEIKEHRWFRV